MDPCRAGPLLVLAAALALGCHQAVAPPAGGATRAPASAKPSKVLLISIDALRPDFLGAYDPEVRYTPNIDHLAAESIVGLDVQTQAPSTLISHTSILYSLYPHVHKRSLGSIPEERLAPPLQALSDRGFLTAAFVGGGQLMRKSGFRAGFAEVDEPKGRTSRLKGKHVLDELGSRLDDWLAAHRGDPFFLFFHTYQVHCPYAPPRRLREELAGWYRGPLGRKVSCEERNADPRPSAADVRYLRDLYAAEVAYTDEFLGRLFATLKALGIYDETIIVLMSDHGESLGERGYFGHNRLYAAQLRIPLVVRLPRAAPVRLQAPLQAIDVLPTIFEALGIPEPYAFEGRSILPLLADPGEAPAERLRIAEQKERIAVRLGSSKLLFSTDGREPDELFDLAADPDERRNLAKDRPEVAADLKRRFGEVVEQDKGLADAFVLSAAAAPRAMDAATREQLRALGYVAPD